MPTRELRLTTDFGKDLARLAKKYPEISNSVDGVLELCARRGPAPQSMKIPGLQGLPVFKERIPIGNRGKRAGARIIYYCDTDLVIALFLFTKNAKENIAATVIKGALAAAGLVNGAKSSDQTDNNA